jgi:hypothetical protein
MLLAALAALSACECALVYSSGARFDSLPYYWSDCVVIRGCVFANLTAGPGGLGGAVSIVAPIADARISGVTFTECRAFGDFPVPGAGGACYLSTTATAVERACAHNCSAGGHAHFIALLAGRPESRHTVASSTVGGGGAARSARATDATLGVDGGSEAAVSDLNFTNCRVSGEGAVAACEPGSRPVLFASLTAVGNSGQSLLRVDARSSKARLLHSVVVDNAVGVAVLTANYFGIDVEATIFSGNGEKICWLTNPSNYFGFSGCVFSGAFPPTWAYSPAANFMPTRTATYAISGWVTALCGVTPVRARSRPPRSRTAGAASPARSAPPAPTERPARTALPSPTKPSLAVRTTAPFEPTEWPLTPPGDGGKAGSPLALYVSLAGGSAIAVVGAIAIGVWIWRAPAPPGVDPRSLAESFTDPFPRDSAPPRSIATLPGDGEAA